MLEFNAFELDLKFLVAFPELFSMRVREFGELRLMRMLVLLKCALESRALVRCDNCGSN